MKIEREKDKNNVELTHRRQLSDALELPQQNGPEAFIFICIPRSWIHIGYFLVIYNFNQSVGKLRYNANYGNIFHM